MIWQPFTGLIFLATKAHKGKIKLLEIVSILRRANIF